MEKLTYVKTDPERTSKKGNNYIPCSIKVESRGDVFINGYGDDETATWKAGDEVDIMITEDKGYVNFKKAKAKNEGRAKHDGAILDRIMKVEDDVKSIKKILKKTSDGKKKTNTETPTPAAPVDDEEINIDEINF